MTSVAHSLLPWDSEFFGFPIARLNLSDLSQLEAAIAAARRDNIRLLYWSCSADSDISIRAKQSIDGFVGDQVVFQKQLTTSDNLSLPEGFVVRTFTAQEPDTELIELAIEAGWNSRFNIDIKFSTDDFRRLYLAWITNSCNGKFADAVIIICGPSGKKAGMVTVSNKASGELTIGLLSVSSDFRRLGIGSSLIRAAENFALQNNCNSIQVATQVQNLGAVGLYERQGLIAHETNSFFHIWLD